MSSSVYKPFHKPIDNKEIEVKEIAEIKQTIFGLIINTIDTIIKGINIPKIIDFKFFETLPNTDSRVIKVIDRFTKNRIGKYLGIVKLTDSFIYRFKIKFYFKFIISLLLGCLAFQECIQYFY